MVNKFDDKFPNGIVYPKERVVMGILTQTTKLSRPSSTKSLSYVVIELNGTTCTLPSLTTPTRTVIPMVTTAKMGWNRTRQGSRRRQTFMRQSGKQMHCLLRGGVENKKKKKKNITRQGRGRRQSVDRQESLRGCPTS